MVVSIPTRVWRLMRFVRFNPSLFGPPPRHQADRMGAAASLAALPEELDHATFKKICGDRYDEALFDALKDAATGCVSKAAFEKELLTKTHVFLTHDWGTDEQGRNNHDRVAKVNAWLQKHGIVTWFDSERMRGNIVQQMFQGIDNARVIVVFITKNYVDKVAGKGPAGAGDNCYKKFDYAERQKTSAKMLAVVQEKRCRNPKDWKGPAGLLGGSLYCDNVDDSAFESNMQELLKKIKDLIPPAEFDLSLAPSAAGGGSRPITPVLAASASAPAGVASPAGTTSLEAEQRKCEEEMFQWLRTNAPTIHPTTAEKYSQAFYKTGNSAIERLGRKLARDGTWLVAQLEIDEDDAEDIVAALVKAGLLADTANKKAAADAQVAVKKAEEAAQKKIQEAEAARKKAEQEAEAARQKATQEAADARKKAEAAEAARKKAEQEAQAARQKADQEAAARRKAEEAAEAAKKQAAAAASAPAPSPAQTAQSAAAAAASKARMAAEKAKASAFQAREDAAKALANQAAGKNDDTNGHGVSSFLSSLWSNGQVYEGTWKNDKQHGHGVRRWPDGNVYEGEYKDDNMHGHGVYRWASGSVYEGEFKDVNMHGHGVYRWASGSVYEGEWKDDKENGQGVKRDAKGAVIHDGMWKDGNPVK